MHPVLAQETVQELNTRHHRQIEAAAKQQEHLAALHDETVVMPVRSGVRTAIGGSLAALVALTRRLAWSHP